MVQRLASSEFAVLAWRHWYRWCAASRCTPSEQAFLRGFVARRWYRWVQKLGWDAAGIRLPSDDELWHRFEAHLLVGSSRARRVYKRWLFARAVGQSGATWQATIEAGATLILRDVVRRWYRDEQPRRDHVSLDAPLPDCPHLTLADLLGSSPSPEDELDADQVERWASGFAQRHFERASRPARVGLLLRALDRPLYGPQAERMAGCGKTKLHGDLQKFVRSLAADVQKELASESRLMALQVAMRALALARERAVEWARAEKLAPKFFRIMEESGGGSSGRTER